MNSVQITAAHAREQQASMLAEAANRRLVRSARPDREPRRMTRRFAAVLVRIAHRIDPSARTLPTPVEETACAS